MQKFFLFIFALLSSQLLLYSQDQGVEDEFFLQRKDLTEALFPEDEGEYSQLKDAFMKVRRDLFIGENYRSIAYKNMPVPSKRGLIHPAPEMIAQILKKAQITPLDKVLLIGRNTLYINEIISLLTDQLYVVDSSSIFNPGIKYNHKSEMSFFGWIEEGPFDVIILFGSVEEIPRSLVSQLKISGNMIFPLSFGPGNQILTSINRYENSFDLKSIGNSYIHTLR
jgi:protein-L-isoaspartate(D-aspartate) O-methyltransferase